MKIATQYRKYGLQRCQPLSEFTSDVTVIGTVQALMYMFRGIQQTGLNMQRNVLAVKLYVCRGAE